MQNLDEVEETLFVPMLGRIYASERFPAILRDEKALSLKPRLPQDLKEGRDQTQYTLLAGAIRSTNIDRHVAAFLDREPDGVIVQLGCGLETAFDRLDNGRNHWFGIDLPDVIAYRKSLLPESEREHLLAADAFKRDWIDEVRRSFPDAPLLVTASGFFYYFPVEKVLALLGLLRGEGSVEVVFDAVNSLGGRLIARYMRQVGHGDLPVLFHVDRGEDLAREAGAVLLAEEPYYKGIPKRGLDFSTRATMFFADLLETVRIFRLRLGGGTGRPRGKSR